MIHFTQYYRYDNWQGTFILPLEIKLDDIKWDSPNLSKAHVLMMTEYEKVCYILNHCIDYKWIFICWQSSKYAYKTSNECQDIRKDLYKTVKDLYKTVKDLYRQ